MFVPTVRDRSAASASESPSGPDRSALHTSSMLVEAARCTSRAPRAGAGAGSLEVIIPVHSGPPRASESARAVPPQARAIGPLSTRRHALPSKREVGGTMENITLGYDGSAAARSALDWVVDRCRRRDAQVTIVEVSPLWSGDRAEQDGSPEEAAHALQERAPGTGVITV